MSTSILSKIYREAKLKNRGKFNFKIEKKTLYKTEKSKDIRKSLGECYFCDLPVMASSGQLIKYKGRSPTHKICRKEHNE